MNNLEEMDKFLETYSLPRLNQEETENLNRQITTNEIKSVIKKLPTNKSPGPDDFRGKIYKRNIQRGITSILLKLFQKNSRRGKVLKLIL